MQHDSIFCCIQPACGHTLPRSVNFCPYCGTAQAEQGARTPVHAGSGPAGQPRSQDDAGVVVPATAGMGAAAVAGAAAAASTAGQAGMPATPGQGAAADNAAGAGPSGLEGFGRGQGAPQPSGPDQAVPPTPPVPDVAGARPSVPPDAGNATDSRPGASQVNGAAWGHGAAGATGARPMPPPSSPLPPLPPLPPVPPLPPGPGARPQAGPAAPPKRDPVRLRWWILALAALWAIWLLAKPSTRRIEAQMDKAMALAKECKPREAQTELIALRKTKATPEQLQEVQKALNDAAGMCTRKRQRDKAWREAKSGAEAALASGSVERARQRLRTFTRRWGEDDDTRALRQEIDARQPEHPRADEVEGGMMR